MVWINKDWTKGNKIAFGIILVFFFLFLRGGTNLITVDDPNETGAEAFGSILASILIAYIPSYILISLYRWICTLRKRHNGKPPS